jgi:peptidoglycan/xylan/chitin deacetylase (PgdA/CDA1 family)
MPAQQMQDPNGGSLPGRVASMASRFIARQSRSKVLRLENVPPMVTFTFDDVPTSACELGVSALERYAARGTFFVAGGCCGTAGPDEPPRASIDKLRTVWKNGHEIGCHTYSHPAIRYISLDELGLELERNQAVLKKIDSGIVLRNFAYPYGDLSIKTKRYLEGCFDPAAPAIAASTAGLPILAGLRPGRCRMRRLIMPRLQN